MEELLGDVMERRLTGDRACLFGYEDVDARTTWPWDPATDEWADGWEECAEVIERHAAQFAAHKPVLPRWQTPAYQRAFGNFCFAAVGWMLVTWGLFCTGRWIAWRLRT